MDHVHLVEFAPRPGGYASTSPGPARYHHTHMVKMTDGTTVQTGPPIGHWPSHAHRLPDGSLTSDMLDEEAFRTGWLSQTMSSSFGDLSSFGQLGTGAVVIGAVIIAAVL